MLGRILKISDLNSFFLFGARGSGKSTLLKEHFVAEEVLFLDLLQEEQFIRFANDVGVLSGIIEKLPEKVKWVVIDEIQKLPKLLDEVHRQIFKQRCNFALTGSSARKLKRSQANMLAGRAFTFNLFPLTHRELKDQFILDEVLRFGTLPEIYKFNNELDKYRFLKAYCSTYLKEEIIAEQLIRNTVPFQRFLPIVAQHSGEIINYSSIARDIGVDDVTVRNYFSILEDTLIGFTLDSYHTSIRKRQRTSPKFYLFDTGVTRQLLGLIDQPLTISTFGYGKAFEHFVILEIYRLISYQEKEWRMSYLRTTEQAEIDLIIERPGLPVALIEIKSTKAVDTKTIKRLEAFKASFNNAQAMILCQEPLARKSGTIDILPWQQGITELNL
jgi:uncharacterized protein